MINDAAITQPLVSVVMPTFNETPEMVSSAIQSILQQTYKNFEFHIFDDSTDEKTKMAIDSLSSDSRIYIHRSPNRVGFIKSLNLGLEATTGKYIARMDGDDFSFPERFEKEVAFLEGNQDVAVIGGQINIIDEHGNITSSRSYPLGGLKFFLFSCVRNPMAHPTIMMRREVVDMGYRYDETLKMSEDLDLWLRLMNDSYKLANIPDTVLNYRVMNNFLAKRTSDIQRTVMAEVRKKNFCKHRLLHSILSSIAGWLFTHLPRSALDSVYKSENKIVNNVEVST